MFQLYTNFIITQYHASFFFKINQREVSQILNNILTAKYIVNTIFNNEISRQYLLKLSMNYNIYLNI